MAKIEKLPSGNYRIRIVIDHKNGKPIRKSFTAPDKMTLRRMIVQFDDQKGTAPMLCDAVDAYIGSRVAVCSPYSIRGYRNILAVLKRLPEASVPCDSPSSAFQSIINAVVIAGKAPKTVKNYAGLITSSIKFAGYPAPDLTLPAPRKKEMFIPDEKLMKTVMKAAEGSRLEVPIALGMMGLRRGEVCAVTATDLQKNILHISRAAVEINGDVTDKSPKTYDSDRYIQVPKKIADQIRKEGRATEMTPSQLSDQFFLLLDRNNLPHFRFHDLRAFFVSYCHNVLKLSDAQVQKLGGWRSDYVMKRHYLHSMNDTAAQKAAAAAFSKLL